MEKRGDLSNENVLILTSKMGLGTYIPALHLRGALVKRKVTCYVDIIENYFSLEQNEEFAKNKRKFHENMRFAKIGHRLAASRFNNLLSQEQMEKLSKRWIDKNISSIVILSGNWLPMAEFYYQNNPKCILWAVHMDVGVTPSWNKHNNSNCPMRIVNVFDSNNINCLISPEYFLPDTNSDCNKVFVHGGGWGMGNYKDAVDELLRKTQYSILTTIYEEQEICDHERCENYLLEKEYVTKNGKKCVYPPLEKIEGGKKIQIDNSEHRALYGLYSECKAIVTKPGGGSLLDSLITRKSLVLLEPIAKHEKENMMLWQKLGFGITFEQWREMEFSSEVLEEMNDRIGKFITNTEIDELSKMVLERAYV